MKSSRPSSASDWTISRDELADVLIYALLLCREVGVSPIQAVLAKIEKNRANYPVELSRGSSKKHTAMRVDPS